MPRRNTVLRRQARKIIYNVSQFMQKEAEEGIKIKLQFVQKRVAAATGVSAVTVRRINVEASKSDLITVFRTPGKKRSGKKKVTGIDSFDKGVIKRCVHNFHNTQKELPTVKTLLRKLKEDINFEGSATSLRRIIKELGFRWKKTEDNRKLLIEQTNIRLKRIEYLEKISKYRTEGRPIIYTDESYVDSTHTSSKSWGDGSNQGLKKKIFKGQRVVIVHAGLEAGFVPNGLLMFKAGTKSGDYHDNMNFINYEKWLRSQLIPNLPPNSVVVVDNASYHNRQENQAPISVSRKSDMEKWLREKGIPFNPNMLKPQLYKLILLNKDQHKQFSIDHILRDNNHTVLRLPPYHPDLNPIEMAWAAIKGYVAKKNVDWNTNQVMALVKEKVNMMGESEWSALCAKVKNIEEDYKKSDHVIDKLTDEIIIHLSGSEESETESEESEIGENKDSSQESDDDVSEVRPCSSKSLSDFVEGVKPL